MLRFVQKQPPVRCVDALTGEPTSELFTFDQAIRVATTVMSNKQRADTLTLIDLRARFAAAKVFDWVEVEDDGDESKSVYAALAQEFKRPTGFGAGYLFAAEDHIRAIVQAPDKRPVVLRENGIHDEAAC